MNFEKFVAKRLHTEKNLQHSISKPIMRMAITAVSLSMVVMILAIATGKGLQEKISAKVTGFTSDIQVTVFDLNQSLEASPLRADSFLINTLSQLNGIEHVQGQITKNALIKTNQEFEGIVVKGVSNNYNWHFLAEHLTEGTTPNYLPSKKSNEILISKKLAQKLNLALNESALFYFQGKKNAQALIRKFNIVGFYETGIELFDDIFVIADIKHLQKINGWEADQIGSLELSIADGFNQVDVYKSVEQISPFDTRVGTAKNLYPQIFDWIQLFDLNIFVILIIMILVASINMISSLLIIILERTKMIGLLKALGATNYSLKKVFLHHAFYLLKRGLIIGNGIGLTIIAIQYYLSPIQLDPTHYYVKALPVSLSIENWLLINLSAIGICMSILIIPALLIQKVEPVKALRYE